jgi:hypothetical protein
LLAASNLSAATHYVSLVSRNPMPPYTNWITAATNIQDAVDVAATNDAVVVTDGVYPGGITVTNGLALSSVNGAPYTAINGGGTNRCVSLTNGASLTGFTLTNGLAPYAAGWNGGGACGGTLYSCSLFSNWAYYGGGAASCTLYNCALIGNSGVWGSGAYACTLSNCTLGANSTIFGIGDGSGGGANACTLYNCTLSGNTASGSQSPAGGGAAGCTLYNCVLEGNSVCLQNGITSWPYCCGGGSCGGTLYNCTLSGNSACTGGGAYGGTLYNCIVYGNFGALDEYNYSWYSVLNYCCTEPLPGGGSGNITGPPAVLR